MLQILSHTPVFVFVLFFVLLIFGFQQTRNRKVKPVVAFILPIFMVLLSANGVITTFGLELAAIELWLIGLVVITVALYKLVPLKGAHYVEPERKLFIPGSWIPFVVIMAIFFTKYAVAVLVAMQVPWVQQFGFMLGLSFVYGGFSGYFTSRAFMLTKVKHAR